MKRDVLKLPLYRVGGNKTLVRKKQAKNRVVVGRTREIVDVLSETEREWCVKFVYSCSPRTGRKLIQNSIGRGAPMRAAAIIYTMASGMFARRVFRVFFVFSL